jgi:hypothetical protein
MTGLHNEYKYIANKKKSSKSGNNPNTRAYYIKYSKVLNTVIKGANKQHYYRITAKSDNKTGSVKN